MEVELNSLHFVDTSSVEIYMDRQRRVQDKGKDLIVQMQNVSESMKINADKLNNTLSFELQKQFTAAFNRYGIYSDF